MTATPKIYGAAPKGQRERGEIVLYSMDDEETYGPSFYELSFAQAVGYGCLVDYKVVVLTVDEKLVGDEFNIFDTPLGGINLSDAAKIVGTWRALAKYGLKDAAGNKYEETDASAMKRAVAFAQVIDPKEDKVSSKAYRDLMPESEYEPNNVMIWTYTFKSHGRQEGVFKTELKDNEARRAKEDGLDIKVTIGNQALFRRLEFTERR